MALAPSKSPRPKAKPSKLAPKSSPRPFTKSDADAAGAVARGNAAASREVQDMKDFGKMKSGGKVKGKK